MIPRDAVEAAEYLRIRTVMAERAERSAAHLARCAAQERDRAAGLRADAERVRALFLAPRTGRASALSAILSPQMRAVLASIAHPHPDDEPFPPVRTIKALARRGLIRFVAIRKPADVFETLHGGQFERLRVTDAGLAALRAPSPPPEPPPTEALNGAEAADRILRMILTDACPGLTGDAFGLALKLGRGAAEAAVRRVLSDACEPWSYSTGGPPDDDSPLAGVFVAGMLYDGALLAKLLKVERYEGGDGSEDFDNDATTTLRNILTGAGLYDPEDGRWATLAAPSAAGEGEGPGDLDRVPEAYREKVRAVLCFTDEDWLLLRACFPEVIEQFRQVIAAAPSPSQGSDTREAGREPGAYGIPDMPVNLSNSDNLRLFSVHHADRLLAAAAAELVTMADEWDEEVEAARCPAPPPTAPQGADLAGLTKPDHEFKSHPSVFWPAVRGTKTFEIRRDDRGGYHVGQTVRLRCYEPGVGYTDDPPLDRRITNILYGGQFELPEGYCILGLAPLPLTGENQDRLIITDPGSVRDNGADLAGLNANAISDAMLEAFFEGEARPWTFYASHLQPHEKDIWRRRIARVLALAQPGSVAPTSGERGGWLPIETAPKDGTLIGVAGGCAVWNEDGEYWYTAVGHSIGCRIQWEITHWKSLDPTTVPPPASRTEGERPPFRTGDSILHKPSGETWVCAWADPETGYLSWLGWPPGEAKISDFELVKAATDEDHRARLRDFKRSTRRDAAKALRLYGDPDAAETRHG